MVTEYWNELMTAESWKKLTELAREHRFILIGGWAAYLWTKAHKSKDIDIVVDYDGLKELAERYTVVKNQRLRKYEIKFDKFDVDIYLPFFSRLAIPPEELERYAAKVEGIATVSPEALLALKQAAEIDRRGSAKGRKDAIDILTLLIRAPVELKKYRELLEKYGHREFEKELRHVVESYRPADLRYIGMSFVEFGKWRKLFLAKLGK